MDDSPQQLCLSITCFLAILGNCDQRSTLHVSQQTTILYATGSILCSDHSSWIASRTSCECANSVQICNSTGQCQMYDVHIVWAFTAQLSSAYVTDAWCHSRHRQALVPTLGESQHQTLCSTDYCLTCSANLVRSEAFHQPMLQLQLHLSCWRC